MESIISKSDRVWIKLMRIGHVLGCHQMPERSFFISKRQLPVCARCTGVMIGELVAIVHIVIGVRPNVLLILGFLFVMGADWGVQKIGVLESTNIRRLVTGIIGGFGTSYVYLIALRIIYESAVLVFDMVFAVGQGGWL